MVWTGDGRVFFYNPSSRTSVWERPEDLQNRTDVDKMISNPPEAIAAQTNKDSTVKQLMNKSKRSGSDESESEEEANPPKKVKTEETAGKQTYFRPKVS